jgi:hypothetical protein
VSPEEAPAIPWTGTPQPQTASQPSRIESGSSALGMGGPSDWEHFQASVEDLGDEDGANTINARRASDNPAANEEYAELPANFSRTSSKREPSQKGSLANTQPAPHTPIVSEVPTREHSVSPEPSTQGLRRTGTIDGVIQAWSTPINSRNAGRGSRKSSVSTLDHSRRDAPDSIKSSPRQAFQVPQVFEDQSRPFENESPTQLESEQQVGSSRISTRQNSRAAIPLLAKAVEVDPYADLGPEYRASLARYVTMLRKEEAAPEEEKYKIFKAFVLKENRLRSILYSVELDEAELLTSPQVRAQKVENGNGTSEGLAGSANTYSPSKANKGTKSNPKTDPSRKLTIETAATSNEDSYVVVERDEESEYSPGGRPRILRNTPKRTVSHSPPGAAAKSASSPSDYAPILVDEESHFPNFTKPNFVQVPPPRPGTAPLAMRSGVHEEPIKFEPPRPAYTPFRYTEGPQRGSEPLALARPAYQAYSELRHQSVDSGRVMAQSTASVPSPVRRETIASPTGNTARREHEEAFLGLIREKSRAYRVGKQGKAPGTPVRDQMPLAGPVDRQREAMDALRKMIPSTMPHQRRGSHKIVDVKNAMGKYPDVFTWIPETVVRWDQDNKVVRKNQEEERQKRQEESEKNIDALFNEHEIGYSDIGQLEADFKLAEATKKYDEDVEELESFTDKVFKPVTDRLKEEVFQLNAQYIRAVDILELEADSGNQYIHGDGERASRSEAMELVMALYNKLQIRHVKTAEAHYERERRRKKLELSVLYTNGDSAAMKKLEQEFSKAEKEQALHEAREKDTRANKLMDTFDRATVRGLGDNQQFIDDVVAKLQSTYDLLKERQESVPEFINARPQGILRSIEELLDFVANDSKSLLTVSNTADNMLNNADYDVSVAEARVANATPDGMKVLEEEKSKEDGRIRAEVDTRMGSVSKGPENALSLLRNIMKRLGDDPQHQDRVQRALEAAKLRNASKTPMG